MKLQPGVHAAGVRDRHLFKDTMTNQIKLAARGTLKHDAWRQYVFEQLQAAEGVDLEQLPSGCWRITRGRAHITTNDLVTLRGRELAEFVN